MLKVSFLLVVFVFTSASANAQAPDRLEAACTGCHGLGLIAQQRLDRNAWTREVDKMIRWGAVVSAAERDRFIDYFTSLFNSSRPRPNTGKTLPEGKGRDVVQVSCMSCHDDTQIAASKFDRAGWIREVDRMIRWGAVVPPARKDEVVDYLLTSFPR